MLPEPQADTKPQRHKEFWTMFYVPLCLGVLVSIFCVGGSGEARIIYEARFKATRERHTSDWTNAKIWSGSINLPSARESR